jgi:integrase/recombinase XerC
VVVEVCWMLGRHVSTELEAEFLASIADGELRVEPLRAFSPEELQAFFDCADEEVFSTRRRGRKGWLSLFRDATLFKVAYAWGLRRREVKMLETTDFGANPQAPEFERLGVLYVRHGKAMKGSAPKHRSVLSVFGWATECLDEWMSEFRPLLMRGSRTVLWPTERGGRVGDTRINEHFRSIFIKLELPWSRREPPRCASWCSTVRHLWSPPCSATALRRSTARQ